MISRCIPELIAKSTLTPLGAPKSGFAVLVQ